MRSVAAVLALGVLFSVAPLVQPAQAGQSHVQHVQAKKHVMKGTLSSIDGDTLMVSVTSKKTGEKKDHKVKADDKTKVMLDGKEAKLSDLKAGQELKITPGDNRGDPASEIEATSASESK
jgi:hypothetical protein